MTWLRYLQTASMDREPLISGEYFLTAVGTNYGPSQGVSHRCESVPVARRATWLPDASTCAIPSGADHARTTSIAGTRAYLRRAFFAPAPGPHGVSDTCTTRSPSAATRAASRHVGRAAAGLPPSPTPPDEVFARMGRHRPLDEANCALPMPNLLRHRHEPSPSVGRRPARRRPGRHPLAGAAWTCCSVAARRASRRHR